MLAKVQKWGNSLALRLPKGLADEIDVRLGSPVEIKVKGDSIVIEPVREKKKYTLDKILEGVKPDTLHDEIDSGNPVGKEIW
ncbi:MAG: AbrB/MazE/SpoVT family DNA-binding domain-containing protein [Desulfuromonadales bacterium]|nr:AbrB/MazE/SpoVT family DNA-binding domain-containing protein [Desulfuromonadales bacterium]